MKTTFPNIALILILLGTWSMQLNAQKLDKYYMQHVQEGGDLFFIHPFNAYSNTNDKSSLEFDITYLSGKDSATLNFTYFAKDPKPASIISFHTDDYMLTDSTTKIYIDFNKKKWGHRFSATFGFNELKIIFNHNQAPTISIETDIDIMSYSVNSKKWLKYSDAIQKILYIIETNNK
nr:hypothetical protein [Bacteroidota bacterium]